MKNLFYFRDLALFIRILRFYRRGQEGKFTGNMTEKWTIRLMQKSAVRKIDTYQKNGIYPGENLILTFETSDMPLSTRTIQEMVRRFLV